MVALREGLLSGCSMNNSLLGGYLLGFLKNILIGRLISWIE